MCRGAQTSLQHIDTVATMTETFNVTIYRVTAFRQLIQVKPLPHKAIQKAKPAVTPLSNINVICEKKRVKGQKK